MTTYEHDINNVSTVIGGRELDGLVKGADSLSLEMESEDIDVKKGAKGDVQVASIHDESAMFKLKLIKGNPMNGHLMAIRKRQKQRLRHFSISHEDRNIGLSAYSEHCYIKKMPTFQSGDEGQESLEWEIFMAHAEVELPEDLLGLILPAT